MYVSVYDKETGWTVKFIRHKYEDKQQLHWTRGNEIGTYIQCILTTNAILEFNPKS